jgi:L-ascorbate metabolism protein UlaG (beta-lactamase superfamily)
VRWRPRLLGWTIRRFEIRLGSGAVILIDTNAFSDRKLIRRIYGPELAMLPIGDLYTMDPREAAVACEFLSPKLVLPMHYGTFTPLARTPEQLRQLLGSSSPVEVLSPVPGETITW